MPSAEMRMSTTTTTTTGIIGGGGGNGNSVKPMEFAISSKDVEGLVLEIKENLRLSAAACCKSLPCRKSSRASPYRVPGTKGRRMAMMQDGGGGGHHHNTTDDPYELLQKLLRDGGLVSEAVRRVKLGLTPKQRYFYESDDEQTPVLRLFAD